MKGEPVRVYSKKSSICLRTPLMQCLSIVSYRWSSRLAFYFAAVGSAVGFGNVWRFPSLVYEYGGGAFFIPYVLALFLIGIPLMILEISLGQYYETGGM